MTYHPDKKQLIDFAANSLKKKDYNSVAEHITKCEECSSTVNSFNVILKSSDNSSLVPPQRVKSNVIGLLNEAENKKHAAMSLRSAIRILARPPVFASIILVVLLSIFFYTMRKSSVVNGEIMLMLSLHKGSVLHNDSILHKKNIDINSGVIKTKDYSSAVLTLESVLTVKVAEYSELFIVNAYKNIKNEIIEFNIALEMRNGNIFASSDHKIKKKFTISTKQAVFEALGTSFIITSNDSMSRISVLEGTVRATSKTNGKVILLNKDEGCIIKDSLQKINLNAENELKKFDILFSKTKDKILSDKEKDMSSEKADMNNDLLQDSRQDNAAEEKNTSLPDKENSSDLRKDKAEFRDESKQIQKEMRSNIRSGRKSQR